MIFQEICASIDKKPYIMCVFQGGLCPLSPVPSRSVHVFAVLSAFVFLYLCIDGGCTLTESFIKMWYIEIMFVPIIISTPYITSRHANLPRTQRHED